MEKYDVVVIGAGPGGYPAAIRAAQLGAKVAIVEREELGGTCLNHGCIPTKALIAAASLYTEVKHLGNRGIVCQGLSLDFPALMKHKGTVVEQLRGGVGQLLKANGVTVIKGAASFESRNRIAIKPSGPEGAPTSIEAVNTIIATGSTSVMPGFIPRHERVVESRAFLSIEKLPQRLLVLGGGYIGCELAAMAAQLGSAVTIVELLEDILVEMDPEARREIRQSMEKKLDIRVLTGKPMEKVEANAKEVVGIVDGKPLRADCLLVSIGRKPVTDGLALDKAGLAVNEKGYIPVDAFGRTKAASIYAVGDVTGGPQLAHAATSQGIIVAENIRGGTTPRRNEAVTPAVIFTDPEMASVGLSEKRAGEQGLAVKTGKFIFRGLGKAVASDQTTGFVKWIVDAETDQLLGATAVGPHATDLIGEATLAIRNELTAAEVGRTIHAHPTFAEIWMEAAHAVHGTAIHAAPRAKKKWDKAAK